MRTIMFNLLVYPHTLKKLYSELGSANLSHPFPKYSEVRNLAYLDACVQEGIRMHPPFALPFERVVPDGGVTILGHHLPAGTAVGGSPYVVNRHKGMFGEDAEFWRPERWLEKDEMHKRKLEQAMLTVSLAFRSSVTCDSHFLFQVWCWQAYLSRKARRHFGDQEDTSVPHSQLRCKFISQLHEHRTCRELTNVQISIVDPDRYELENSWFFFQRGLYARIQKRPEALGS